MPTINEALDRLRIRQPAFHHTTLKAWMRQLKIEPGLIVDLDGRYRTITDDELEQLVDRQRKKKELRRAAAHGERHATPAPADGARYPPSVAPSESPLLSVQSHVASKRPYQPYSERAKLPDGWVSFNAWCSTHGVNHLAVQKEIKAGRMPAPERGEWWERPQGPTLSAYSAEQHTAASTFAAKRWPARFTRCDACG